MLEFIILSPLFGAFVCGFFHRVFGEKQVMLFATVLLSLSAIASWLIFLGIVSFNNDSKVLFSWFSSGSFTADWSIKLDSLVKTMLVVVTSVSSLVHLYSIGYMDNDHNWEQKELYKARFFSYLSLFTFAMLVLVSADNILQLFFGWEGVGLASYLLIGFYYKKPSANSAAIKAFIVNRIGDFFFLIGIFLIFVTFDTVYFSDIFESLKTSSVTLDKPFLFGLNIIEVICFFLFVGAMGKSAQIFLHTWLPDAMEGPTPVSALIHAATMVTAGVFLTCRFSPVFEMAPVISSLVVIIGSCTALFAASVALVQTDIKRIIAYSTCSQLGYMFVAAGAGFYHAAIFHLFTHAFFKALLFLGAGSIIHAMHHEQDIRRFGGLRLKLPWTFVMMLIGTLAITGAGIPLGYYIFGINLGLSGFVSKDIIIEGVFASTNSITPFAFYILVFSAFLTSFYSWRLMFLTFFGKYRGDRDVFLHCHESSWTMLSPLIFLSLGSIFFGSLFEYSFTNEKYQIFSDSIFLSLNNTILHDFHHVPTGVKIAPFCAMALGVALAFYFYLSNTKAPQLLAKEQNILYQFLLNKWYFDEFYEAIIVKPIKFISKAFWQTGDIFIINGSIHGIAMIIIPKFVSLTSKAQSGFVYHYALVMIIGFSLILSTFVFYLVDY